MKKKEVRVRKKWTVRQKTGLILLAFFDELVELYQTMNKLANLRTKKDRRIFWTLLTVLLSVTFFLWVFYIRKYEI
jgi:hypothetical protein